MDEREAANRSAANYVARLRQRIADGKSRLEALRCLKRHLARRLYRLIPADLTASTNPT